MEDAENPLLAQDELHLSLVHSEVDINRNCINCRVRRLNNSKNPLINMLGCIGAASTCC
jgi:hypothetical protein